LPDRQNGIFFDKNQNSLDVAEFGRTSMMQDSNGKDSKAVAIITATGFAPSGA